MDADTSSPAAGSTAVVGIAVASLAALSVAARLSSERATSVMVSGTATTNDIKTSGRTVLPFREVAPSAAGT
ncbi:hypothetical protein BN971_04717 [Mycobacterium bohemicum DSM 44277]|uniref:Uncharacterized protein n=1 Tax=Mycobacterium bohemicum DSM 44277 TaxID=1236609 RepID=A0A0U0WF50_MYCBE|nr:hypothetical protein [Mycobacterium bohemicum]CPR13407.1 hypothetical protein BN971_04717 [Mycobacterium bohemicum DSM 44277]